MRISDWSSDVCSSDLEVPHLEQDVLGLATPTLIVWGEEDRVLDSSGAEILHRSLPNSQIVIMPGIGYMPMLATPRQAASDYNQFPHGLRCAGTPVPVPFKPSTPTHTNQPPYPHTQRH